MDRSLSVGKIRAFNRFYMPLMNVLGNDYLNSRYSAAEARVLFEINESEGCNAAYLSQLMNLDKGYLSRIVKSHEEKGFVSRKRSSADKRSYSLFLTVEGKRKAEELAKASDGEIASILDGLSEEDETDLIDAIDTITRILKKKG